jgi:hypothetical protein
VLKIVLKLSRFYYVNFLVIAKINDSPNL